jgi:transcriptional regulator with XRE-family HTH domain
MIVKKLRLQQCWSQEQLSEFSGLSVRTIQRIERGQQASLESLKSLAAVFQININELQTESLMHKPASENAQIANSNRVSIEEKKAIEYVEGIKAFYQNLFSFIITISCLTVLNLVISPNYFWVVWCIMGWGIGLILHGIHAFELFSLFSPKWEKAQIEKRLGRKL